jgi:histidinol-phosphate phosphatase family protein
MFLDRDGVLIDDVGYISTAADVRLLPGVVEGLGVAALAGFALVVVSNQSGVGRGIVLESSVGEVDARMRTLLAAESVQLDGSYYCLHAPDTGCACRKPLPGLLHDAARDLGLDLGRSWVIGDRDSDLEAGLAAGCTGAIAFGFTPATDGAIRADSWPEVVHAMGLLQDA